MTRPSEPERMTPQDFISRWQRSGGAELANSQSFLKELCKLLGVPQPEPTQADESKNSYVFEKAVSLNNRDGTSSLLPHQKLSIRGQDASTTDH